MCFFLSDYLCFCIVFFVFMCLGWVMLFECEEELV